ncbi:N-acetyl-alpha-D-glucosaminyl L-malate synthase BshA [Candidatus Hydrogenedentota bacterium]
MKIGITCYPTVGGSGVLASELGKELAHRGHEIHFMSYAVPFRLQAEFHRNIFFHQVEESTYPLFKNPLYSLTLAAKMAEVAENVGLDILHAHYAIPHATCAYLAKQIVHPRPLKIVTTLHGTDITLVGNAPSFKRVTKFSIEQSDTVTCVSKWLAQRTTAELDVSTALEVIYNFVDLDRFQKRPKDNCPFFGHCDGIVMHMSNFRPVKRVCDVIRIFARIGEHVDARLLMLGDGPDHGVAADLARELGVMEKVTFLGEQASVRELVSCADVFLLPSEHESFGLGALEAMACEVPVVSSDGGGLREVVVHGETGYIASVGDVDTMAEHAVNILTDRSKGEVMGRRARERVRLRFNREDIVSQYESLYKRLLDQA